MLNCGRIRYIAKADFRLLAEGAYAFGRFMQAIAVDIGDDEIGAGVGEAKRQSPVTSPMPRPSRPLLFLPRLKRLSIPYPGTPDSWQIRYATSR